MICNLCKRYFNNKRGLSKHLQQKHKMSINEILRYYIDISNQFKSENKEEYIQCKICNDWFKSLQYHIRSHNISSNDYKNAFW